LTLTRINTNFYFFIIHFCFSAGGLVTAVAPVVIKGNGLWIGWTGVHLKKGEKIPESDPIDITPTAGLRSDKVSYLLNFIKKIYSYIYLNNL
jgi:trehalose 6-phosphate synthase/phosphatase